MAPAATPDAATAVPDFDSRVSVVVAVKDEADNIAPLIEEIHAALDGVAEFEVVYVDDGSTDATPARLAEAQRRFARLRVLRHRRACGQSTALATGIRAARHPWIATLDGDRQNDPADILALLARLAPGQRAPRLALIAGWRTTRHDSAVRKLSSRIANAVRGGLLGDRTPDTGCGLKVFPREVFLRLPFFDHMHRFLPALFLREGLEIASVPVRHRPRVAGRSKYGIANRLWVGLVDLLGVLWLQRRMKLPETLS
ncbi:glycosyltransferase family 2 protein [Azohydromonas caseinilytica]|uniref:Glycosyltransferase family 2 protein n=1 Tax=Azohydromonas caseinilytica TaxID=2728836 RepID=A0A848FFB3_9BURK|nr:glycosyltransferase family 2 protein [Azohydromonas caseinilytica]NML16591.1 glycosyltransferase family 2 protein [Azohydromonas caseinilytica]